jgi:hypothetical protein
MRRWVFALVLAGCPTHKPPALVTVRSPDAQPVVGATVGWVCTPSGDGAAVSDASGVASVTVYNSDPDSCVLTVAKIGFRTVQLENQTLGSLDVTLEPSP